MHLERKYHIDSELDGRTPTTNQDRAPGLPASHCDASFLSSKPHIPPAIDVLKDLDERRLRSMRFVRWDMQRTGWNFTNNSSFSDLL
jgi:hypothetical protein